jgi:hypothetical protein
MLRKKKKTARAAGRFQHHAHLAASLEWLLTFAFAFAFATGARAGAGGDGRQSNGGNEGGGEQGNNLLHDVLQ